MESSSGGVSLFAAARAARRIWPSARRRAIVERSQIEALGKHG
jgi:hypothetical protein